MSRRRWSEEEINRLRSLYVTEVSTDLLSQAFPGRTLQAIRQKASRLGLRRMASQLESPSSPILLCRREGVSEALLLRCSNCRSWIRVDIKRASKDEKIICGSCGHIFHLAG